MKIVRLFFTKFCPERRIFIKTDAMKSQNLLRRLHKFYWHCSHFLCDMRKCWAALMLLNICSHVISHVNQVILLQQHAWHLDIERLWCLCEVLLAVQ